MLVEENANLAGSFGFVFVAKPRMISEQLCLFVEMRVTVRSAASGSSAAM